MIDPLSRGIDHHVGGTPCVNLVGKVRAKVSTTEKQKFNGAEDIFLSKCSLNIYFGGWDEALIVVPEMEVGG